MMNRPLSFIDNGDGYAKVVCACGWESARFRKSPFDPMESLIGMQTEHMTCLESPPMIPPPRTFYAIGRTIFDQYLLVSSLFEGADGRKKAQETAEELVPSGGSMDILEIKVVSSVKGKT